MALFGNLGSKLLPFLVSIGGAVLAWVWLKASPLLSLLAVALLVAVGFLAFKRAPLLLRRDPPQARAANRSLETAVVAPAALAVAASAVLIWLAIDRTKDLSAEDKAIVAALVAAVTTFLTATFVKDAEDSDEKWVGKWAKACFNTEFKGKFKPNSESQKAAQDDLRWGGWGASARRKRAQVIESRWTEDRV